MALREKLRRGAEQHLRRDEEIQAVFLAKRPFTESNDRAVVATNQRLLLLEVNSFAKPLRLIAAIHRNVQLGPWRGFWMYKLPAFSEHRLKVNVRFSSDIAAADEAAGFGHP